MMTDTQWPRFIVFHQEKSGAPHVYSGSVHASDAEMALLNARDVFVRRPLCVSLWVVPAAKIFSKTAEELTSNPDWLDQIPESNAAIETYYLFEKRTQKGVNRYIGEISTSTPELALKRALGTIANHSTLVWWIIPERFISRSTPEDIEILFAPATTKDYRDQAYFPTEAIMQRIKAGLQKTDES